MLGYIQECCVVATLRAIHRILKVSVHCYNDLLRARICLPAGGRLWTLVAINGMKAYLCLA